jgi:hypothetical protein
VATSRWPRIEQLFACKLIASLHGAGELQKIAFVSTNYDILIDNALTEMRANNDRFGYGTEFRNFDCVDDWRKTTPKLTRRLPVRQTGFLFCVGAPARGEVFVVSSRTLVVRTRIAHLARPQNSNVAVAQSLSHFELLLV